MTTYDDDNDDDDETDLRALAIPLTANRRPSSCHRSNTAASSSVGRPSTPPRPSSPWISGSVRARRRSGLGAPRWAWTSTGASKACSRRTAFACVSFGCAFPWQVESPRRWMFGAWTARRMAIASSCPGSQSADILSTTEQTMSSALQAHTYLTCSTHWILC